MELREYLTLFRNSRGLILAILAGALAFGVIFYRLQPQETRATLLLNIGRSEADAGASRGIL